jgi:dolichyl-phosphate-mannose-protein mannosyltransferase
MKFSIAIITTMSLLTHLLFFGEPRSVVFDEVYMGNFISSYSQNRSYFDIHPPLAKLLDYWIGVGSGVSYDNVDFSLIGNEITPDIIYLRILPLVAGILLPIIAYYICRRLNLSEISSFTVGIILCFENSIIVQSRYILFDSVLLLFGFSSLLLYLIYIKDDTKKSILIYSAILASFAYTIKWTGFAYPLLIVISEIIRTRSLYKVFKLGATYFVAGLIVYTSAFFIHFSYTPDEQLPFLKRFWDTNKLMFTSNTTLTTIHQYGSKWYTWPFMIRPVFYWQNLSLHKYIYLMGNPFIYLFGTASIFFTLISTSLWDRKNRVALFLVFGFLVNFIPFIFIGRVMFLYHYEAALVLSIMSFGFVLDKITKDIVKKVMCGVAVVCSIALFIYFSPLTYGLPQTDYQLNSKMWLSTWR